MRTRLILTFSLVMVLTMIIALLSAVLFFSTGSVDYLSKIQTTNTQQYLQNLANYYTSNGSWNNVEAYFASSDFDASTRDFFNEQQIALVTPDGDVIYAVDQRMAGTTIKKIYLTFASKINVKGEVVGYIVSGRFLNRMPPNFSEIMFQLFWSSMIRAGLVSLLVGLILSNYIAYRLLRPVQATIDATRKISAGDLSQRVPEQPYSDLSELVTAINEMAVNLEKNDSRRSQLFADLAHDLRTPLAVQRASLEAVEDGIYPFNQETLSVLKQQNMHLQRLLQDLGMLARLDVGIFTLETSPQDLSEFFQAVIDRLESILIQQNLRIKVISLQKGLMVEIDCDRIEQVLENLFQNAMRYAPANSSIDVSVFQKGKLAVLTMHDYGLGIPEDKLETIFERYYQLNDDDGQNAGGQGIGLAIARRLARVHGGNLFVRNHPEGGAEFVLELPLIIRNKFPLLTPKTEES